MMRTFTAVIERDPDTGLFVGYVPGWPGAHSQGASVDELRQNLEEVVAMLLEDGEPKLEGEFIGTQTVTAPFHAGRDISPILLRVIARDIGMDVRDFVARR